MMVHAGISRAHSLQKRNLSAFLYDPHVASAELTAKDTTRRPSTAANRPCKGSR